MKAKQAIDLLENGIMPCVLSQLNTENSINYICGYYCQNFSGSKKLDNSSQYNFITLNGDYLSANNLNDEISMNNNSGGGQYS